MRGNDTLIGPQAFDDQVEQLVEQGMDEKKAESMFRDVKTGVMLLAQEKDKGWSQETVNAITNVIMAMKLQQARGLEQERRRFYGRLNRFLTTLAVALAAGTSGVYYSAGNTVGALAFAVAALIITIQYVND